MKKTLYSLMLSEDVVREVDALAHRMGTNRSNLINQILAEYVDLPTPERRINDVFTAMEGLMKASRELVPFFAPNAPTLSVKSSLEYKYRPTVKYEVELYRSREKALGELSVIFRTQSAALLELLTRFFRLWKRLEDTYLVPILPGYAVSYALYEGKFVRSIALPERDCTAQELAETISAYVEFFDRAMKAYLAGRADEAELAEAYRSWIARQSLHI